ERHASAWGGVTSTQNFSPSAVSRIATSGNATVAWSSVLSPDPLQRSGGHLAEEESTACSRLMDMASIAYHAPSRPRSFHVPVHLQREAALLAAALVLLLGGLALAFALHGSHSSRTPSLVPAQTQKAP